MSSSSTVRERENDDEDLQRDTKRPKVDETTSELNTTEEKREEDPDAQSEEQPVLEHVLPPSHVLLGVPLPVADEGHGFNFLEKDVGISEYVGQGVSKIEAIIKQRFTDFLVYEVDLDGNVIHLKSLEMPSSTKKNPNETGDSVPAAALAQVDSMKVDETANPTTTEAVEEAASKATVIAEQLAADTTETPPAPAEDAEKPKEPWPESFTTKLSPYLSEELIVQIKQMFLEGPEPPRVPDSGWGGRPPKASTDDQTASSETPAPESESSSRGKRGRGRGRDRGGRSGGRGRTEREDHRKVLSDPIESKDTRTTFHQVIRELFGGKLDSETDRSAPASDSGSRIMIRWARRGVGRGGRERKGENSGTAGGASRDNFPPYIHFTLQKTNRDTQDALSHLSRTLHVSVKDLSVAGTKDKRGVTVQRVSLKRNSKTVEDVWRLANGMTGRRSVEDVMAQRGERGVRIADFNYRKASLELGMLKGNAFVITLRNVQVDSTATLDKALNIVKNNGFINYYGMQRFGTASVPTHSIGLALLKSDWHKAVALILQTRHGEHPDVEAARNAWLVDKDLDRALTLMPRRVVAERCILESYKKQKGDTRNAMGALSTIPRNLRLMYIHAYQSYVWNAIVSGRIRMHGSDKPVVGDLVFDTDPESKTENTDQAPSTDVENDDVDRTEASDGTLSNRARKKMSRQPWTPPRVKTLTEDDVNQYTIFDVIMPLPGTDVAYPGGKLGDRYREFLKMDGLDPDNFVRKQRDYTLGGSYRKILHVPSQMSWKVLRYTDPEVPLAQADEDKLLGFDSPVVDDNGKFMALQINLTLGTASYATMALREITKTETSSHYQSTLTVASEDQKYRGVAGADIDGDADTVMEVEAKD